MEADLSKRTADHGFVPGDPACGWDRQCSVIVPVIECGEIVGAHCGRPPEDHAIWASARAKDSAMTIAAPCRCGWTGDGPHLCHRCGQRPGTRRFICRPVSVAGAQMKLGAHETCGCDECVEEFRVVTEERKP